MLTNAVGNPPRRRCLRPANGETHGHFGERFGELGRGFIHVHHVVPVSEIGESYEVDPIKDLIPLCPNCHAMIHRRNPPLSVDELKGLM
ncbi:TPA: HNH endonuclease [Pseudomonas aeruginosa]|nr:HNH endonuclease [Pseudomonas aeruginosa]